MSNLSEDIIIAIKACDPKVTHLNLCNHRLEDNDISELQELLQNNIYITSIDLSHNHKITAEGCRILGLLPRLNNVNLSNCSIDDKAITYLVKTKIEYLNVSNCSIGKQGGEILLQNLDQFKLLTVYGNTDLPNEIAYQIECRYLKNPVKHALSAEADLGLNIFGFVPAGLTFPVIEVKEQNDTSRKLTPPLITH